MITKKLPFYLLVEQKWEVDNHFNIAISKKHLFMKMKYKRNIRKMILMKFMLNLA